jgi:hypothetical protein
MQKGRQCSHYPSQRESNGSYVDCIIDNLEYGFCHKCFLRYRHLAGVVIIRYVTRGSIFKANSDNIKVPF